MPEGWAWCRLKNICTDFIVPQRDKPKSFDGTIPWCRIEDIEGKYLNGSLSGQLVSEETIKAMNMHKCPVGSIICSCSASLGVQAIATVECCTNQTFIGIVPSSDSLFNEYLYYLLKSQTKYFHKIATGTTIKYISRDKFEDLFVALPPIEEQKRIVSRINKNFEQIELLEHNKNDLEYLIRQTKSKILDLAIHGKLVPQDPNDEPAEELLKRIATSDNRPYKKFDKDDSPYTLPTNWAWCYLGDLCKISSAKRVLQQDWKDSGIPFYRAREIAQLSNNEKVKDDLFITPELYSELKNKYGVPISGDLMISAVGTIGKVYIVKESDCFYYKDASVICFSKKDKNINSKFLKLCLESSFLQNQIYSQSTGTTVDTITINKAQEYLFPLPNIKEQSRIVSKIEELFSTLDTISSNLE